MHLKAIISLFARGEHGTVAILWGTAFVAFLGFFAITLDVGRLNSTHSELQSFADNVALAAAGELDGQPDAITRATNAAANLISDSQTFATGASTLSGSSDYTLSFHSALPVSDLTPLGADVTTNPREAKFAQVVLTPKSLSMNLASALDRMLGGVGMSASVSAEAVAGYSKAACDISPLMFCLPPNWENTLDIGDQILLRSGGNGTAWGPGNFGFIDLATFEDASGVCADEGGNKLACLIAAQSQITQCVLTNGLDTEPGQKVGITNAHSTFALISIAPCSTAKRTIPTSHLLRMSSRVSGKKTAVLVFRAVKRVRLIQWPLAATLAWSWVLVAATTGLATASGTAKGISTVTMTFPI